MKHVGQLIQQRREAMNLSQAALSREMGGYPSASLMSRSESGDVDLTPSSAHREHFCTWISGEYLTCSCGRGDTLTAMAALMPA